MAHAEHEARGRREVGRHRVSWARSPCPEARWTILQRALQERLVACGGSIGGTSDGCGPLDELGALVAASAPGGRHDQHALLLVALAGDQRPAGAADARRV